MVACPEISDLDAQVLERGYLCLNAELGVLTLILHIFEIMVLLTIAWNWSKKQVNMAYIPTTTW